MKRMGVLGGISAQATHRNQGYPPMIVWYHRAAVRLPSEDCR